FHGYIATRAEFRGNLLLCNALIEMYSRTGVLTARRIFDSMETRDLVTYTSMISGYGSQGKGGIAVELFEEMIKHNIKPDDVAMVAILSACGRSRLVSQGRLFFEKMVSVYCITPGLEHFACMVDLYGRAGLLKKAKEQMWAMLIGACRVHGSTEIGEWAAEKLLEVSKQRDR
ncbi:hypothetical protein MIMGU_mgv1a0214772mg, partial [Erythranthe guttata]